MGRISFSQLLAFMAVVPPCFSLYIQCTSQCSQLTLSFLEPFAFPSTCQAEQLAIQQSALICSIDYRIDYDAKQIYINFKATNESLETLREENQTESLLQSVWLGFRQASDQPNITNRAYACRTENDCARSFYLSTIEYLVSVGQLKLNEIRSHLYNQTHSSSPGRCVDNLKSSNRSTIGCARGLCYAHSSDHKRYCTSDLIPMFFSEIEDHTPDSAAHRREVIEFRCNTYLCNRNATIKKVRSILLDYTNWNNDKNKRVQEKSSGAIREALSYSLLGFSLFYLCSLF